MNDAVPTAPQIEAGLSAKGEERYYQASGLMERVAFREILSLTNQEDDSNEEDEEMNEMDDPLPVRNENSEKKAKQPLTASWWRRWFPAQHNRRISIRGTIIRDIPTIDRLFFLVGSGMSILAGAITPVFLFLFCKIINAAAVTDLDHSFYALLILFVAIGSFLVNSVSVACLELFATNHVRRLRVEVFRSVLDQEMGWFDTIDPATLTTRVERNMVHVRNGLGMKLGQIFLYGAMSLGSYITSFAVNWRMALLLMCAMPFIVLSCILLASSIVNASKRDGLAYQQAGLVVDETVSAIRTVAAFGAEKQCINRYEAKLETAQRATMRGALWAGLSLGGLFMATFLMYALGFYYGGRLIAESAQAVIDNMNPNFDASDVLVVFFGIVVGAFSLGQVAPSLTAVLEALRAITDLYELIDRRSNIAPSAKDGECPSGDIPCAITFRDVKFAFPSRKEKVVFSRLNLHISAGEVVALVGSSGCGKSTIVELLERYYDVDDGTILIDDRPLTSYNLNWWRSHVSMVGQEPRLFSMTVGDNIASGAISGRNAYQSQSKCGVDAAVAEAARRANAEEFILSFPDNYNTEVGESGSQLSGGQKQRIAVARGLMRQSTLLILDEATSALDRESERLVQNAIDMMLSHKDGEKRRRTTVIIAHRLSTIKSVDRIIVLGSPDDVREQVQAGQKERAAESEAIEEPENAIDRDGGGGGSVVLEEGTHDELMDKKGAYYALVCAQSFGGGDHSAASNTDTRADVQPTNSEIQRKAWDKVVDAKPTLPHAKGDRQPFGLGKKIWCRRRSAPVARVVPLRRLFSYMTPYWIMASLGLVASVLNGLIFPSFSVILSMTVNVLFATDPDYIQRESEFWACMFVAIAVLNLFINAAQFYCLEYCGQRVVTQLRKQAFTNLIHQELSYFDSPERSPGNLATILSADAATTKGLVGNNTGAAVQTVIAFAAGFVIAFISSPELAAVTIAAFIVMVPCQLMEARFMHAPPSETLDQDDPCACRDTAGKIFCEAVSNIRCEDGIVLSDMKGQVTVEDVNFRYPQRPGVPVYHNISFSMGVGTVVALVGSSGCGKSTIVNLLERFYDVEGAEHVVDMDVTMTSIKNSIRSNGVSTAAESASVGGTIKLDGVDIRELNLRFLRSQLGLVSQEPILFDTSIEENVRLGKPDATKEEIVRACKIANAHRFIANMSAKYDTVVGRLGGKLSGGQKQRIAIARALVRNPRLLILDEATSALDSRSERIIQRALDRMLRQETRTTLVIAHRLQTTVDADKIVVLQNKKTKEGEDLEGSSVVESGTHAGLMKQKGGVYRQLVDLSHVGHG